MRNIFVSLLLISLTFSFLPSDNAMAARKKKTKKTYSTKVDRPSFARMELKEGEVPKISLSQLAYMTKNERIIYFQAYREAMLGMERVQRVFDYDVLSRSKVQKTAYEPTKKKGFFARLLGWGDDAEADRMPASTNGQHGRGSNCDRCIFAYNLSNYGAQCRRFPFGCEPPASCNNGRGLSCDPVISGVQGTAGCISRTDSIRSTRTCDSVRQGLADRNSAQVTAAINAAQEYFELEEGIDNAISTIDPAKLNSPRAQQILDALWDVAYSDAARGDFFVIAEIYRRRGVTMPNVSITNANGQSQSVNIANLNIYNIQENANGLTLEFFQQHRNLCTQELAPDVVQEILDGRHIPSDRQISGASNATERQTLLNRKLQEEQRQTAARELRQRNSSARLTVRNVLQVEECRLVDAIYERLSSRVRQAYLRMPVPPQTPQSHVISQGCPTSPDADQSLIYSQTFTCTKCMTELTVRRSEGLDSFISSNQWDGLLSAMSLACGRGSIDGRREGRLASVTTAAQMRQTFGVCSAHNEFNPQLSYNWDMSVAGSYINPHDQHGSIREWNTQSQIGTKGEGRYQKNRYRPDRNDAFRNVYGISYEDAEKYFCDVLNGERSLEDALRRAERDIYDNDGPVSTSAPALVACMREASQRASRTFGATSASRGEQNCTASTSIDRGFPQFYAAAGTNTVPGRGMVMHNNEDCLVTKQIEYLPGEQNPTVAMVLPEESGYNSVRNFTTYVTALQAGATRPLISCRSEGQRSCSYAEESSNMQVTYPVACTASASGDRSNGRRRRGNN